MSLFSLTVAALRRANDEYEMQKRGLLKTSPTKASRLIIGGLCAPAWLAIRTARGLRDANSKRFATLQRDAFKQAHPINPNDWAIVCPYQLGDVYLYSALATGLLPHHGGDRVIFFTKPQHAFIPRLFPSISETIVIKPPFQPAAIGRHVLNPHPSDVNKGEYFKPNWGIASTAGYEGMTMLDAMRANFRLPRDIVLEKPRAPYAHELAAATRFLVQHGLAPGRVVILCPDATSTVTLPPIPDEFWDALIAGLKKIGLHCVTNVGGPAQRVLKGAPALQIPIEDLRAVACAAGHMISNRSGVSDLVSDLSLNQAVLYPMGSFYCSTLIKCSGFQAMGWSDGVTELEIDCQHWLPTVDALLEAMNNTIQQEDPISPVKECVLVAESDA